MFSVMICIFQRTKLKFTHYSSNGFVLEAGVTVVTTSGKSSAFMDLTLEEEPLDS